MTVPVAVLTGVDPILLDVAAFSAATDTPGAVVVRAALQEDSSVRLTTFSAWGVEQGETVAPAGGCAGCSLQDRSLAQLHALMRGTRRGGRPSAVLVGLPAGVAGTPLARRLTGGTAADLGVQLAGVVSVLDLDTAVPDLLGEMQVRDRGLSLCPSDARSVAHALSAQLHPADLVLTRGRSPAGSALVDHLRGAGSTRGELTDTPAGGWFATRHNPVLAERRLDLRRITVPERPEQHGVWTLTLTSTRPLHPHRWRAIAESLDSAPVRSRGAFALPTRTGRVAGWDAAGGQLLVRDLPVDGGASWAAVTRLQFTGMQGRRGEITRAFESALLTDAELALPAAAWGAVDDGLDPWLGERGRVEQDGTRRDQAGASWSSRA